MTSNKNSNSLCMLSSDLEQVQSFTLSTGLDWTGLSESERQTGAQVIFQELVKILPLCVTHPKYTSAPCDGVYCVDSAALLC